MTKNTLRLAGAALAVAAWLPVAAQARDQIRIVGSSTVYPFATAVAEEFGHSGKFKTPIVESTGTGGGLKLFCAGAGDGNPDIANASRRIKSSEVELCAANGVKDISEVMIGFDGIAFATSVKAKPLSLTLRQIFLALAKEVPAKNGALVPNPHKKWSDVDPSLPNEKIEVLGPPPTSGTRDSLNELAIEGGCKTFPELAALADKDKTKFEAICRAVREDGAYIDAGENDNLIVQKLIANPNAVGVFGYSYLEQNTSQVRGSTIEGIAPTYETISEGKYPISRSLYFYVKKAEVGAVPGIREYVAEFTSEKAIGDEGYLADKGLIAAPKAKRDAVRAAARELAPLDLAAK
jgi:phosphate transport system substrate-binding protein